MGEHGNKHTEQKIDYSTDEERAWDAKTRTADFKNQGCWTDL